MNVLIADDHPIFLQGLVALLQGTGHSVVARCVSGPEVVDALGRVQPDILVLDLNMPAPDGLEIVASLRQPARRATTVLLTSTLDDDQIVRAVRLGVGGIVLKESASQQLIACIDAVRSGRQWFDPEVAKRAIDAHAPGSPAGRPAERLTPRELDVARLVARGLRNKEIAQELTLTEGTVKTYLHAIYDKLNVASRYELIKRARDRGLM